MTLRQVEGGVWGDVREIEVVEHRDSGEKIFATIHDKMVEKAYEPNTILACLALTPGIYDFRTFSMLLGKVQSKLKHVFIVFTGAPFESELRSIDKILTSYTMVQLLPIFAQTTLDVLPYLNDFQKRYDEGQEYRIIMDNVINYGTTNPLYPKVKPK